MGRVFNVILGITCVMCLGMFIKAFIQEDLIKLIWYGVVFLGNYITISTSKRSEDS